MQYKRKFDLEDIYKLIQQEEIVNQDERELIIDNMNVLPPSEMIKLIRYMKNVRSVEYLKKYIVPNLRHLNDDKDDDNDKDNDDLEL